MLLKGEMKMTQEEIKNKIIFNNREIEKKLDPSTFILQPEVIMLMEENDRLREECNHVFENGVCVYCGKEE